MNCPLGNSRSAQQVEYDTGKGWLVVRAGYNGHVACGTAHSEQNMRKLYLFHNTSLGIIAYFEQAGQVTPG